jgi:ABC-type lipopolysaccharide export system ATPase subunit
MTHLLQADSIQLAFNGRSILSDIYLEASTGSVTGLLGRNGEGKSCLMKIIYGSLPCEKSVRIDKQSKNEAYRQPAILRYLPQFNFIPKSLSLKRVFRDFSIDYGVFCDSFPEFASKYTQAAGRLSGGELRMVELYAVVKPAGQFALLDEPFTHLNPLQIEKVKKMLLEEKQHKGLLITDHMYRHVTGISDKLYVLSGGKTHLTKSIHDLERLGYARI